MPPSSGIPPPTTPGCEPPSPGWRRRSCSAARRTACRSFPSSLRVDSVAEAGRKLAKRELRAGYRDQLLAIARALIEADPDEGISTDELVGVSGLKPEAVRHAMFDLETLGIASNDTALTAFVHVGVQRDVAQAVLGSRRLGGRAHRSAAGNGPGHASGRCIQRCTCASSPNASRTLATPKRCRSRCGASCAALPGTGATRATARAAWDCAASISETVRVTLNRPWKALAETALRRRSGAERLLDHLLECLPPRARGTDLLAETTFGKLMQALKSDLELKVKTADPEKLAKLLDRALLWLHEQEVVRLNKGLAVFRPAMTIHLGQDRQRRFLKANFMPLDLHYKDQVLQVHVMAEFAQRGLDAMAEALRLAMDYFSLSQKDFLRRWLPRGNEDLARETTPESWRSIVESLKNRAQQEIVADDEERNVLVLAGPGSGKTRVLVHRIAYLLRVRRENPRGIIALAYNRHAAVEIRRRLAELVGDDARGVLVYTCHGLAMRLVGASFSSRAEQPDDDAFKDVMRQAVALLRGDGVPPEEADEHRTRLLAGFRWILVDEYQDVGPEQYELISALAGRTLADEDDKLSLFAVGDDDQNIYAWAGCLGALHPPVRGRLPGQDGVPDGQLPLHGAHRRRRQRGHRTSRREDEGRPSHSRRPKPRQEPGRRRLGSAGHRGARAGADSRRRARSHRPGPGGDGRVAAPLFIDAGLELVGLRHHRPKVEVPGTPTGVVRDERRSGANGQRANPQLLVPARDPGAVRVAARTGGELPRRRCRAAGLAGPAASRPLDRASGRGGG